MSVKRLDPKQADLTVAWLSVLLAVPAGVAALGVAALGVAPLGGAALAAPAGEPATEAPAPAATAGAIDHLPFDQLLRRAVVKDRVDYSVFKGDAHFAAYLEAVATTDPATLPNRASRLAFWINAYNALTIASVLAAGPGLQSVADVAPDFGFFKVATHAVAGQKLTLDAIENRIIRPQFKDARIHAALNCASVSCPPLQPQAFVPARLEAQLESAMRAFVNDVERNAIGPEGVRLSRIFDWYAADFAAGGGVRAWLDRYLDPSRKPHLGAAAELGFLEYDWKLNRR